MFTDYTSLTEARFPRRLQYFRALGPNSWAVAVAPDVSRLVAEKF